jgi:pimeloyl-ACP methyl ester carboxylesterase
MTQPDGILLQSACDETAPCGATWKALSLSFRLAMNLKSGDYFGALERTKKPMALIAGGDDDQFYADRHTSALQPVKPDLTVELVPGPDHVDMLMKPAALVALRRTFDAIPRQTGGTTYLSK